MMTHLLNSSALFLALTSASIADSPDPWEVTGAAGFSATSGNSDSIAYHLQLLGTYEHEKNEAQLGIDYFGAENDDVETTKSFRAFAQYNRLFSDRFYLGLNGEFLADQIADVDYRYKFAALAGYYFVKNDATSLSFEAGPGYSWQQEGGVSDSLATMLFAQHFKYKFNANTKLWQSISFGPRANDFSDHILRGEIGVDLRVNEHWALRTSLRHQIDSTPAAGRQKDDTALLMGFSYALNGFPEPKAKGRISLIKKRKASQSAPLGWTTTASAGISYSSGNSDSSHYHLALASAYREAKNEAFYDLAYTFGENDSIASEDRLRATARYNRVRDARNFIGTSIGFLRDDLADIAYRASPAITAGRYLIKSDDLTLSIEGGHAFTFEEVAGTSDSYFAFIAAERLSWAIDDRTTLKQEIVANISGEDSDNFTLVATAQLETAFTQNLNWMIGLEYLFDNQPAAGKGDEDLTLKTGLTIRF
ncbi:DUF481 domain-containing protein [Akkermansiaceae bacterium]|nr:DUF481 domain-containing protein [Akkermansiaceae bacterium]